MILIGEHLNDTVHQILLSHCIFANDYDLQQLRKHYTFVQVESESIKMAKSYDVLSNSHSELISFNLSHLQTFLGAEMLKSHPQSVHLAHVLKDEVDCVIDIPAFSLIGRSLVWQLVLHHLQ